MALTFDIFLVECLFCFSLTSLQQMRFQTYKLDVSSSDGSALCALDVPTVVTTGRRRSMLHCTSECTMRPCCVVSQLNIRQEQCQLYDYLPVNYSTFYGCKAFYSSSTHVSMSSTRCEFPFTFIGQLYYTCAVNRSSSPCQMFCLTAKLEIVPSCAPDYLARNVTQNVTIPQSYANVSLMSVNGWLTILSRVNSGFPVGLSYSSYRDGFGSISSNFWLGLEKTYGLTNTAVNGGKSYRLRVEMLSADDYKWYSEEYDWFYLEGETASYILHVTASGIGDAVDALNNQDSPSNGKAFKSSGTVCTSLYGPWWFTSIDYCSNCRVFGNANSGGFQWIPAGSNLVIFRMMIKPTM